MSHSLHICLLDTSHCSACANIAKTAPDPWQEKDFSAIIGSAHHPCYVLLSENDVAGFACFLTVENTADLQLITIAPQHRQKGYALFLLQYALNELTKNNVEKVLLEVRCGNTSALALYEKLGFQTLARRNGMYRNPTEDGFLMAKDICKTGSVKQL